MHGPIRVLHVWIVLHNNNLFACREGVAHTNTIPETRIWHKFDKDWKCVHTHRSRGSSYSSAGSPKSEHSEN